MTYPPVSLRSLSQVCVCKPQVDESDVPSRIQFLLDLHLSRSPIPGLNYNLTFGSTLSSIDDVYNQRVQSGDDSLCIHVLSHTYTPSALPDYSALEDGAQGTGLAAPVIDDNVSVDLGDPSTWFINNPLRGDGPGTGNEEEEEAEDEGDAEDEDDAEDEGAGDEVAEDEDEEEAVLARRRRKKPLASSLLRPCIVSTDSEGATFQSQLNSLTRMHTSQHAMLLVR